MEITKGKGARVIFDPIAGPGVTTLAKAIAQGGTLFIYGGLSGQETPFPVMLALGRGICMRGYTLYEVVSDHAKFEKGKKYILEGLASGKLKPIIAKTFSLDQIVDAHRFLESNKQFGKIVVTV
jgi:NADPH:quinone reductase-like Zn-dependent oxidoreductase